MRRKAGVKRIYKTCSWRTRRQVIRSSAYLQMAFSVERFSSRFPEDPASSIIFSWRTCCPHVLGSHVWCAVRTANEHPDTHTYTDTHGNNGRHTIRDSKHVKVDCKERMDTKSQIQFSPCLAKSRKDSSPLPPHLGQHGQPPGSSLPRTWVQSGELQIAHHSCRFLAQHRDRQADIERLSKNRQVHSQRLT